MVVSFLFVFPFKIYRVSPTPHRTPFRNGSRLPAVSVVSMHRTHGFGWDNNLPAGASAGLLSRASCTPQIPSGAHVRLLWCMRSLSFHRAQSPDLLPQWARSEGTRVLQRNGLHNTDAAMRVPAGPAHVDLLWVRRLASRGMLGCPSPGPEADTPQPGAAAHAQASEAAPQLTPAPLLPASATRLAPTHWQHSQPGRRRPLCPPRARAGLELYSLC